MRVVKPASSRSYPRKEGVKVSAALALFVRAPRERERSGLGETKPRCGVDVESRLRPFRHAKRDGSRWSSEADQAGQRERSESSVKEDLDAMEKTVLLVLSIQSAEILKSVNAMAPPTPCDANVVATRIRSPSPTLCPTANARLPVRLARSPCPLLYTVPPHL